LMTEMKARFPQDLDYVVSLDTTLAVTAGIREIVLTLFEALALVILVVFLFLQSVRATLIPLLAVPVSLVGAFAVFPLLGFSINTLSLFGLVLAIGLVVDDAIVVVEAVEHHIERGLPPPAAPLPAIHPLRPPPAPARGRRPRRRHRPHPRRRLRPHRLHPRHHRPHVPAVRRHHRRLRRPLRLQRPHPQPRPRRPPPPPPPPPHGPPRRLLP